MPNTATRLLRLILLLQEQPNQKAEALAGKLEVSVRTLHRYMSMLEEMGIPLYTERGPYGGFSLMRGYKMPPLIFSPEEAITLVLGTQVVDQIWGDLYHEAAQSALSKLEHVLPEEQLREVRWAQQKMIATGFQRLPLHQLEPDLKRIRQAMKANQKVEISYLGAQSEKASQRIIHPVHLVHRAGLWYLIAWCELRQAMRSFRLDRIQELVVKAEVFTPPSDFDVQAYLAHNIQSEQAVAVRMRFLAVYANLAAINHPLWTSLTPEADGGVIVEFSTPDMMWAASLVLSYGPTVMVLQPPELKQVIREWAAAVVSQYT